MSGDIPFYVGSTAIGSCKPLPLAGYGRRKAVALSNNANLEANWIAFEAESKLHVVISIDALFSSNLLENKIRQKMASLGQSLDRIMIVASHTHYAPNLDPHKTRLGAADYMHVCDVAMRIALDIHTARKQKLMQFPFSWWWGAAPNGGSVFRRASRLQLSFRSWPPVRIATQIAPNPRVDIDQNLRLWIAKGADLTPLFALATWPCHATSRADFSVASADFVAPLRDALRTKLGQNIPVVFLPGASGDIRPGFWKHRTHKKTLYPYPFQKTFSVPSSNEEATFDEGIKKTVEMILSSDMCHLHFANTKITYADFMLKDLMVGADTRAVSIYSAVIGGIEIIGIGAEISAGWVKKLGLFGSEKRCILSGCVGQVFGYLPTPEQISEGGYEVHGFRESFEVTGEYKSTSDVTNLLSLTLRSAREKN